ncbi:DUF4255 domain-containing protein [Dactylosporangium sp. NPDC051485]|uniref:DUF4255 domain-containing protein n=1 Tax=Dactylosporangium sp. NPDC051485 TaxID=3154846 RepID=UPI0034489EE3
MFQDLDASLAALVEAELGIPDVAVSFVGPDNDFPPASVALPAISFFLYDIREDLDLRSGVWEIEDGQRRRPPARVNCSYLITAWPTATAPNPAEDEHRMLGALLKVLLRHRSIPAQYLRGELIGQEPPMPTRITADNQLTSLGEFWQAMGGRPKASLHYAITLSFDVAAPAPAGPQVTTHTLNLRPNPTPAG